MKVLARLAVLFSVFAVGVNAQNILPDAPVSHFHARTFIVESEVLTLSNILDGITTVRDSRMGIYEADFPRGSAELLGRYPDAQRYVLVMASEQIGEEVLGFYLERSHSKFRRVIGHTIMLGSTGAHLYGFGNNLHVENIYRRTR